MEVIFLGTGTSQGVPMIACDCPVCRLEDPRNRRTRTSVHVVMDGVHIQVDAAQEFRLQCLACDIQQVDRVIMTHAHADHILGMDDLRRFCDRRGGEGLPVYSSPEVLRRVRDIYPYAILDRPLVRGYPAFRLEEMPAVLEIDAGRIHSVRLPHGPIEVLGLVFEERSSGSRFAYYTDCKEVGPEAQALAQGAGVVVLDALRREPHGSHMTLGEAIEAAGRIEGGKTYFTHMTHGLDHGEVQEELPQRMFLAYDGLRISV